MPRGNRPAGFARARGGVLIALLCLATMARAEVAIQAHFERTAIQAGESTTLVITVVGAGGNVGEPDVELPDGIQTLGTSRSQSFSWSNGKSSAHVVFRSELGADRAGTFAIGPISVRVGAQVYQHPSVSLTVAANRPQVGVGARGGAAAMIVDVTPRDPYVGQPVILRVRLVERSSRLEDPQYTPPATPGFWGERASQPKSDYEDERGSRVVVTETRTRLFPLAAGTARVGEAIAVLTLSGDRGGSDPLGLFGGGGARTIQVQSAPVDVHVRALPAGAPPSFDGAVGQLGATWLADRQQTPRDVPITVVLDVRGTGNLPLMHTPVLATAAAEVFSSTVVDSFGGPGSLAAGRRRFQWTVLPRTIGTLRLEAPALTWFDDASGRYVQASLPPVVVEVTQPVGGHDGEAAGFPLAFSEHPLQAQEHPVWAWGLAISGVMLGLVTRRIRALRGKVRQAAAPSPPWLEGLRHARGSSFWAAAGRACESLAAEGVDVTTWKVEIDAARFGGHGADEARLRGAMLRRLDVSARVATQTTPVDWLLPGAAVAVAVALLAVSLGLGRGDAFRPRALQAESSARRGDIGAAAARWRDIWKDGARSAALAARLAWGSARAGDVARASAWVLRGEHFEPRDPALCWTAGQVRDAGGLEGYAPARLPVRNVEWGLLAMLLGFSAGFVTWRGRWVMMGVAALSAFAPWLDSTRAAARPRAVVSRAVSLDGAGVDLRPGQVVRLLALHGNLAHVSAGARVVGDVSRAAIITDEGR